MKALSIKQPWASLIAHGIKDIENRTWKTNYRGRIYVHASSKPSFDNLVLNLKHDQIDAIVQSKTIFPLYSRNHFYPVSAIIGEVDIIDCVINHPSIWAEKSDWYTQHTKSGLPASIGKKGTGVIYNWVLDNPVLYKEPILNINGALSLWEWEGGSNE